MWATREGTQTTPATSGALQHLPEALGVSMARVCAAATSSMSTYPAHDLGAQG